MSFWKRFFRRRSAILGLAIVAFFIFVAADAERLAPPFNVNPGNNPYVRPSKFLTVNLPQAPSSEAPLGTSKGQVDVYQMLVWGARDALRFSLTVALSAAAIGILLGAVSGMSSGWVNGLILRVADGFLTIPIITGLVLMRQLQAAALSRIPGLDPGSVYFTLQAAYLPPAAAALVTRILSFNTLLWAMILFTWIPYTRIVNAMVVSLKSADFVEAVRAMGGGKLRIMFRHLLPNAIGPAIVLLARDIGGVVILQASLTYAGFGGNSTWGNLLLQGRDLIIGAGGNPFGYWWVWLPGTLALVLFGIGWNLVGDGLTDALDVRLR